MKKFFEKFFGKINFSEQVDAETKRLENNLAAKRNTAIEFLGEKWILHPVHNIKK